MNNLCTCIGRNDPTFIGGWIDCPVHGMRKHTLRQDDYILGQPKLEDFGEYWERYFRDKKNWMKKEGIEQYIKDHSERARYNINNFSLDTLKEAISEYMYGKDNNETVEPDIIIYEGEDIFSATINNKLMTGLGGLQMYFDHFNNIDFMKVRYNGYTLNLEEKQELFNKIKKEKQQ